MKQLPFKKYQESMLEYEDYSCCLDAAMGEEKVIGKDKTGKDVYARDKFACELTQDELSDLVQDICFAFYESNDIMVSYNSDKECSILWKDEHVSYTGDLEDDLIAHWSDVITDWISESEGGRDYLNSIITK